MTRIAWSVSPSGPPPRVYDQDICGRCGDELDLTMRGVPIPHECCTCRDTRRVMQLRDIGEQGFGRVSPCPDCAFRAERGTGESAAQAASRLAMGIPPMYVAATLDAFQRDRDPEAYDIAREYSREWPPTPHLLTLASNAKGNGKTTLACAVLNEIAHRHHVYGRFESWPDLVAEMRDAQRPESSTPLEAIVERISTAEVLVLDDVGVGRQTEFVEEQLYREVNRRYAIGRPLIVTTNTWARLDDRIRSRLADRQRGRLVLFHAGDARPMLPLGEAS